MCKCCNILNLIHSKTQHSNRCLFLQLACPIFHHGEWSVFFADTKVKDQIHILHSKDSEITPDQIQNSSKTFMEQAHKAFDQCGYKSPFPSMNGQNNGRVASIYFESSSRHSALASMMCLEHYNGIGKPFPMPKGVSVFPS